MTPENEMRATRFDIISSLFILLPIFVWFFYVCVTIAIYNFGFCLFFLWAMAFIAYVIYESEKTTFCDNAKGE